MGHRYYCDYCDKTFIDDLDARKKHLSSSHHIKLRNLHYEKCRDLKNVLAEESIKAPCRRFFQTGTCMFIGNCKYTHYSEEELWNIKQQTLLREYEKKKDDISDVPSVESWLEKYNKRHNTEDKDESKVTTFWSYPEHLESRTDLPPSLIKFQPEQFLDSDFEEWGV